MTLDSNNDYLYFDDVSDAAGSPTGGTTRVTDNDTGQTYKVDYSSGSPRVYANGTDVTPSSTSNVDGCGFQEVGSASSGGDTQSDLAGTWEPDFCAQTGSNESADAQYTFTDSSVTATLTFYSDDSCSEVNGTPETATWTYSLGDAVPQSNGPGDAIELDMISSESGVTNKYDIVRVEGDTLYLGEPDPTDGADDPSARSENLDVFDTFSRSQ